MLPLHRSAECPLQDGNVMARRKTTPELVREKNSLAERLRAIRAELFGERGGPEMARRLGIPVRTWENAEAGGTGGAGGVGRGARRAGDGPTPRDSRPDLVQLRGGGDRPGRSRAANHPVDLIG